MELVKILCGSAKLFEKQDNFTPGDFDYVVISDDSVAFKHIHPAQDVCLFVWGKDKQAVREYILKLPYYLTAMSLVTKEFVEHYEFSWEDINEAIDKYLPIYERSNYRYYVPLFKYIKEQHSWDFPKEILEESYVLYKRYKKR